MPFATDDTIVAIATPAGRGGIGVVRISGPEAVTVACSLTGAGRFQPRHATLARVRGAEVDDQAVVTWFQAPASYTGEEVIEISAHGSPVLLRGIVAAAIAAGARLAEPGEFTLRAYLSGRMDLVQAEAVRDLVDAVTPLQARSAFDQLDGTLTGRIREIDATIFDLSARLEASMDFPAEGYHFVEADEAARTLHSVIDRIDDLLARARTGRLIREGAQVVITGRPNVGKSTLFNALVGASRAIVTDVPGTTRDLLTETVDVQGIPVTLVDTAGVRVGTGDAVEAEGIARARRAAEGADLVVAVLDRSSPLTDDDRDILAPLAPLAHIVVAAKADLRPAGWDSSFETAVRVAALTGSGIPLLRETIALALGARESYRDAPAITNVRHTTLLRTARDALRRAADAAGDSTPEEFVAADIAEARRSLEEITGRRTADDTLRAIFEQFCIGK